MNKIFQFFKLKIDYFLIGVLCNNDLWICVEETMSLTLIKKEKRQFSSQLLLWRWRWFVHNSRSYKQLFISLSIHAEGSLTIGPARRDCQISWKLKILQIYRIQSLNIENKIFNFSIVKTRINLSTYLTDYRWAYTLIHESKIGSSSIDPLWYRVSQ